jgi:hypothetical protein
VDTLFPQNWPDDPDAMLRLGRFHISAAWHARGGGNADTVTEEGWKRFEQHLKQAETHLRRGWKADGSDARLPTEMLTVAIGRGFERGEMETWFERAMKADTNNVDACERKLSYLEPKWHGSAEQVLAFGRKCAASGQWGGSVPLILPEAHRRVASYLGGAELRDYWANPAVWTEIRSCYEAFALRSPKQTAFLQQYAWFAYRCGQWQELRRLVDRMGPVNYAYFGGRKAYDRMIQDLEEHSGAEAR